MRINQIGLRGVLACAGLVVAFHSATVSADSITFGAADNFVILGLNNGDVTINSATSITGNVGYSSGVTSNTNQKVDTFTGTAYVHSGVASFSYAAATYVPSGGIQTNPAGDALLNQANVDANTASAFYASLAGSNLGNVTADLNLSSSGPGATTVFNATSFDLNGDTFTLNGLGSNASFVFNVSGDFDWSDTQIILNNVSASNVLFNFTGASSIVVNKDTTVFAGTILAPNVGADVIYHNPATFTGRIIASDITVHSDFNITAPPTTAVPLPPALAAGGVLMGIVGVMRRRGRGAPIAQ